MALCKSVLANSDKPVVRGLGVSVSKQPSLNCGAILRKSSAVSVYEVIVRFIYNKDFMYFTIN